MTSTLIYVIEHSAQTKKFEKDCKQELEHGVAGPMPKANYCFNSDVAILRIFKTQAQNNFVNPGCSLHNVDGHFNTMLCTIKGMT